MSYKEVIKTRRSISLGHEIQDGGKLHGLYVTCEQIEVQAGGHFYMPPLQETSQASAACLAAKCIS